MHLYSDFFKKKLNIVRSDRIKENRTSDADIINIISYLPIKSNKIQGKKA
jgi:hypothetical protein